MFRAHVRANMNASMFRQKESSSCISQAATIPTIYFIASNTSVNQGAFGAPSLGMGILEKLCVWLWILLHSTEVAGPQQMCQQPHPMCVAYTFVGHPPPAFKVAPAHTPFFGPYWKRVLPFLPNTCGITQLCVQAMVVLMFGSLYIPIFISGHYFSWVCSGPQQMIHIEKLSGICI